MLSSIFLFSLIVLCIAGIRIMATALTDIEVEYVGFYRDAILNRLYNDHKFLIDGSNIDRSAHAAGARTLTLTGQRRMDHMVAIVATIVEDKIPGNIIETGVWRGGMMFMVAKTLDVLHDKERVVYLSDSFQGIPDQVAYGKKAHAHDLKVHSHTFKFLNDNSVSRVKHDSALFSLDASRLSFVVGYFNASLPKLVKNEPQIKFSVVRLDGDTYWSTMEAITILYPRLSPGGFLVIDDFTDWDSCRDAIYDYRKANGIKEQIFLVPHLTVNGEYIRGAYWRKSHPNMNYPECLGTKPGSLRAPGSYNPSKPVKLTKQEASNYQGQNLKWTSDQDVIISRCDV